MKPVVSAKIQPIGMDHQIPFAPIDGMEDRKYANNTRVPKDIMVSMTDI